MNEIPAFGTKDDAPAFKAWLEAKAVHESWPIADIIRIATEGARGDDDFAAILAARDIWGIYSGRGW